MFNIPEELSKLPHKPGVYLMHDANDNIIYVGKAVNLFNRVRSYFRASTKKTIKIERMVSLIDHFEYIVVDSELEALVLENNLIKEYNPKYNTLLKDSKTYPYIKVSMGDDFPKISMVRRTGKDKSRYFGPYTSANAVNDTIELLNATYGLRSCNKKCAEGVEIDRPCLNFHMGRCMAPCRGNVSRDEYMKHVDQALDFLNGNDKSILKNLREKMEAASESLNFEDAIKYRELLENATRIIERQKITDSDEEDRDIIGISKDDEDAVVQVFFIRNGKMIGREHHHIPEIQGLTKKEILTEFVKRYYTGTPFVPREIMLPMEIDEEEAIAEWLSYVKGKKVKLLIPKIGQKEKLVELANKNASIVLNKDREKLILEEKRTKGAINELGDLLNMPGLSRVEAYDISNTNGFQNVGSMVVFEGGKPVKGDYRKFRIKTVSGPDDYACMHEVLTRRFTHGFEEQRKLSDENLEKDYGSFARFPDLILMDGGRGQVNIALKVLSELNINIPVCGMVKDDNHNTRGLYVDGKEIDIDKRSESFKLITRIQDEAHRFAIEYHKSLREKRQVHSVLEDIPGVGEKRRLALMRSFKSIDDIKKAEVTALAAVDGMNKASAEAVYNFFHTDFSK
ncbi:MAG: excinuclease ABC subunit UvrC [Lachnospiraceae bacterium]|nr:excinuclease ABC subunit UvrC [Lachnospiraceae bacterium]